MSSTQLMYRYVLPATMVIATTLSGCMERATKTADEARRLAASSHDKGSAMPFDAEGQGAGESGDRFDKIDENRFLLARSQPLSTFSVDVDTASYAKVRQFLLGAGKLPPPDAVRMEELINYFNYDYPEPGDEHPFSVKLEVSSCPWRPAHHLVRIGLKGRSFELEQRPPVNLVFLIDVSGSMSSANKLPLLKRGLKLLVEQLEERDSIAIAVYAGAAGLVLPPTQGDDKSTIMAALDQLQAGGSTNGGEGIHLAYRLAQDRLLREGINRVLLCTDGDFNVGTTSNGDLVRIVEQYAKSGVSLTVLGFGMGNHNDSMLEQISNRGDGNYAFIDTLLEARKVLVEQLSGTLVTIAKDVKIQVEFNPEVVKAYRLIGYENRMLAAEDFNDDKKDAGEIGAGHEVTALYEVVLVGAMSDLELPEVDALKYQESKATSERTGSDEWLTVKLRYKAPDESQSRKLELAWRGKPTSFELASLDHQFASAVAAFGMLLRDSTYKGNATYDSVYEIAASTIGNDRLGYRTEFARMIKQARTLTAVNR